MKLFTPANKKSEKSTHAKFPASVSFLHETKHPDQLLITDSNINMIQTSTYARVKVRASVDRNISHQKPPEFVSLPVGMQGQCCGPRPGTEPQHGGPAPGPWTCSWP